MKILVISRVVWNMNTNFGNTYTSFFKDMEDVEIAHLCFGAGTPNNKIVSECFQVTQGDVLKKLLGKSADCGHRVEGSGNNKKADKLVSGRVPRLTLTYLIRDFLWLTGVWKTKELYSFLDEYKPDLIFAPLYKNIYMNKIIQHIVSYCKIPMLLFVSDDVYSLKQIILSPLSWIYKFWSRKCIFETVGMCKRLYTISEIQKNEYEKAFNKPTKILYKGDSFSTKSSNYNSKKPIKIVYTGNLSAGRWKTVSALAKAIKKCNEQEKQIVLHIYSHTQLSKSQKDAIEVEGSSLFFGGVAGDKIPEIQDDADILLHCESFNLKNKLEVRMSFSTKIVDYFKRGKCIFAIGPCDIASMDYLKKNDAAVIAENKEQIEQKLKIMIKNPELIYEYGNKAWECGKLNHKIDQIQVMLYNDFKELYGK